MRPYRSLICPPFSCPAPWGQTERPSADTDDRFRMAESAVDAPSMANLPWWELLKDEQLQKLVRMALAENKDLQKAAATVEEFQARAWVAKSDFLPNMTASGNAPSFGRKTVFLFPVSQPVQLLPPGQSVVGSGLVGTHQACQ